jgi:hypothetical protein
VKAELLDQPTAEPPTLERPRLDVFVDSHIRVYLLLVSPKDLEVRADGSQNGVVSLWGRGRP